VFGDIAQGIFTGFLEAVASVLIACHWLLAKVFPPDSGWTWAVSLVALAVSVRVLLMPLSIYETRSLRTMQRMQPRISVLQDEFRDDRKRLVQEQRNLWKESGTNPALSCLPVVLQGFIFLNFLILFGPTGRVADGRSWVGGSAGESLANASLFGDSFGATFIDSSHAATKLAIATLVILDSACAFALRYQLTHQGMPPETADLGPYGEQEKFLLVGLPIAWFIGGFVLPLGGLVFFATWYVWALGEQSIVIRSDSPDGS
jgi:YidC/Oxa1 family membrane protein insertase